MAFRNLSGAGDWVFGSGKNSYVTENQEIGLNIQTRVLSFLGDCFFAAEEGIDWFNLLEMGKQEQLENSVQETIKNTPGVTAINSVDVVMGANRKITITYDVQTIYSESYTGEIIPLQ